VLRERPIDGHHVRLPQRVEPDAERRPLRVARREIRLHLHDRGDEPEADQRGGEARPQYGAAALLGHFVSSSSKE
jgi:hypothetical protein